jgi:hypothetical protein
MLKTLTDTEAGQLAFDFLMNDLEIASEDQDWFSILSSRLIKDSWFVVEIGVEGLPDKWLLQVYDTKECDPNYTFNSPITLAVGTSDLEELPERIANAIAAERR